MAWIDENDESIDIMLKSETLDVWMELSMLIGVDMIQDKACCAGNATRGLERV